MTGEGENCRSDGGNVEILAPAGSGESLAAAVRSGAAAVYLGGKQFNARRGAENFDDKALGEAVTYCHARGVKVYLAMNTLVFDTEIKALESALESACAAGVDALIVQDLAVARLARQRAPGLALHASTQMSVHSAAGARMLEELGFSRVVLARELSREEIAQIRRETAIELEVFVHGALCMSVSGQCYLSSMIGGRSGNRGMCAQPCRLPFTAGGRQNALSLRDQSLLDSVRELAALDVCSLKIEGRMKRPEYVAAAVNACLAALQGEQPDYAALEAVFSRTGFTRGYYDGHLGEGMFGVRRKEDVQSAAPVLKGLAALYKDERQSVAVEFSLSLVRGRPALLAAVDNRGNRVQAEGPVPMEALTAPTTAEKARAALGKTGGTYFHISEITMTIEDGLMIPASALNRLRREALEQLAALREKPVELAYKDLPLPRLQPHKPSGERKLRARLSRAAQLTGELAGLSDEITLPAEEWAGLTGEQVERYRHKLLVELPDVVFHDGDKLEEILLRVKAWGITGAVAGGLGAIETARRLGFAVHGGHGLNITNSLALMEYEALGLRDLTVSFELDLVKLRGLGGGIARGMLAYGFLPLMTTRNCPVGSCAGCRREFPTVTDRLGNRFFVDCSWQVARLYNHLPLCLSDRLEELSAADFLTLYFTREPPGECAAIAGLYREGGPCPGERTKGLYYRKVQ